MFERTFSFWRRLVGKTPPDASTGKPQGADAQADRRLWVRYPANVRANVLLDGSAVSQNRVSARVRDISLGGANLLVDHPIESGQMLSLELPRANNDDTQTVLACVVRVVPLAAGQWALGCVFSRELTEDDLKGFGAQKVRHGPTDKRTWMRFVTNLKAHYQKVGDPENHTYPAQIINLSASGVGLAVSAPVDAGALLSLDLIGTQGKIIRTILACVVHVTTQTSGGSALGCNFIRELSEEDLKALV